VRALQPLLLVSLLAFVAAARADQVPNLDVEKSCREAKDFGATTDPQQTYKNCMLDEKEAKDQLVQKWSQFKPADRRSCGPAAPSPSYVEMLTCLEMNQESLIPYSEGGGAAAPAYGRPHGGSPSPRPPLSPGPRGMRGL